jgi:DnaK suppressor protein
MPQALADRAALRDRLPDQLPALRARLEHQRRFRLEQVAALDTILEDTPALTNAADRARHEVTVKVAAAARQALFDIDAALTLMANGDYGRCQSCHADISMRLLQAIPSSQLCLKCRWRLISDNGQHPARRRRLRANSGPSRRHHPAVTHHR